MRGKNSVGEPSRVTRTGAEFSELSEIQNKPILTKRSPPSLADKMLRGIWQITYLLFFRFSPTPFHAWRRFVLRLFGAQIGSHTSIYPSVSVWAPWNLVVGNSVTVGSGVILYNVDLIELHDQVVVSQGTYLCTATHDYCSEIFSLMTGPILIEKNCWVAVDAFVSPGVHIGASAVVGARSTVHRHIAPHSVVVGSPARVIGLRPVEARNFLG